MNSRAIKEYISKTTSLVIPFVLLNERVVKDNQHNKIWEHLLENGGSSDSQIALLLTENLRDIYAYIFPLIYENNSRENSSSTQLMGSNALAYVKKYLSEEIITRQAGRESYYIVRRLLKLSSKDVVYNNNTTIYQLAFVNSIKYIADQLSSGKSKLKSGCIFQDTGTSIT